MTQFCEHCLEMRLGLEIRANKSNTIDFICSNINRSLLPKCTTRTHFATMKEAIVSPGPSVKIVDSPIPKPGSDDVIIKIVVSGSNPKDWKVCRASQGKNGTSVAWFCDAH